MKKGSRLRWNLFSMTTILHLFLSLLFAFCTPIRCYGGDGILHVFLVHCMYVLGVRWLLYRNV